MHQTNVSKIRIKGRFVAITKGVIAGASAAPCCFVVKEAEKTVRAGTDIQPKGPDRTARLDSFGITDSRKGVIGVPITKIQRNGPHLGQVVDASAAEHTDIPRIGVPGHCPKAAVCVAVGGECTIGTDTVLAFKLGFAFLSHSKGVCL